MSAAPPVLYVFVPGTPKPQGSKRGFVVQGQGKPRAVVVDSAKRPLRDWRSDVIGALRDVLAEPIDEPVSVSLMFVLPRPASRKNATHPSGRVGDLDKLSRAILDALEIAGVITDDCRVVRLAAEKAYPNPGQPAGVHISIYPVTQGVLT